MTNYLPLFNIPCKTVDFSDNIFTLKFRETKFLRVQFENFIILGLGYITNPFKYYYNGNTYICCFYDETLKKSVMNFGYSEFELKIKLYKI